MTTNNRNERGQFSAPAEANNREWAKRVLRLVIYLCSLPLGSCWSGRTKSSNILSSLLTTS